MILYFSYVFIDISSELIAIAILDGYFGLNRRNGTVGPQQGRKALMIRTIRPLDRPDPGLERVQIL